MYIGGLQKLGLIIWMACLKALKTWGSIIYVDAKNITELLGELVYVDDDHEIMVLLMS